MTLLLLLVLLQQLQGPPQVTPLNSVPVNPWAEWNQDAETLQEAQGFVYRYYLDGMQTPGAVFAGVECGGTARPWLCRAQLPVTIGGEHTLTMTSELATCATSGNPVECRSTMTAPVTFTIELLGAPTSPNPVIVIK